VIDESERKGTPSDLFWPWCAANVSVLAVSYGAFVLGFSLSLVQALFAAVVGAVLSFLLVGLVSIAGKRGSAPTLVLSRAAFGRFGNSLPGAVSYLLLVGWETVLVSLATFATATVFGRLGWGDGNLTKVVAFLVVAAIIVAAGILGFDAIMKLQKWLTIAMIVVTALYIVLTFRHVDLGAAGALKGAGLSAVVGATILVMTGFGVGWVNSAADYSRYLPRNASTSGVVGWPTFGGSLPVVILIVYGVLLAASDSKLSDAIALDPIGALTKILPTAHGYGSVNPVSVVLMAVATLVGWGLVIDTTGAGKGLGWLGFLLGPLGLGGRTGAWAFANLGVPVALVLGFVGYLALQAGAVRRSEPAADRR
jgi:purine-cytosine permease-like protein